MKFQNNRLRNEECHRTYAVAVLRSNFELNRGSKHSYLCSVGNLAGVMFVVAIIPRGPLTETTTTTKKLGYTPFATSDLTS